MMQIRLTVECPVNGFKALLSFINRQKADYGLTCQMRIDPPRKPETIRLALLIDRKERQEAEHLATALRAHHSPAFSPVEISDYEEPRKERKIFPHPDTEPQTHETTAIEEAPQREPIELAELRKAGES